MESSIIMELFVFTLALFAGAELIARVPQTLHTPLMSGSNAISGVSILGALIAAGHASGLDSLGVVGFFAVACGAINVVGGYLVTDRMLRMFKSRTPRGKRG